MSNVRNCVILGFKLSGQTFTWSKGMVGQCLGSTNEPCPLEHGYKYIINLLYLEIKSFYSFVDILNTAVNLGIKK